MKMESSKVLDSKLESSDITIEDGAQLNNVEIRGKQIIVKANAFLNDCKLFSSGIVKVGQNTLIKENAIINAFKSITIGDGTIIDREVLIGGMQSERSEIEIGNGCVVLFRSYLNVTRKIFLGNNVGVGGYCLIFTHSAWQNVLEGNPYRFDNVTILDNSWIPWNVTIMPGITIGENVTVGSGSIVTKNLPPNVFAAGVPARIIRKKEPEHISDERKKTILLEILTDFTNYLSDYVGVKSRGIRTSSGDFIIESKKRKLIYTTNFNNANLVDILLSFKIPDEKKAKFEWIELDSLASNTTSELGKQFLFFIRRYGLKITT